MFHWKVLCSNFISNLYIVYKLKTWPGNPVNNFTLKNCLFGTVKFLRYSIKSKFAYNCRGKAFDGEASWSFGNYFARNVVIFGVDNSSSSFTNNRKKTFLVVGEGLTQGINDRIGVAEKKCSIIFVKQIQSFP